MSEEQVQQSPEVDPILTNDLDGISPDQPLLPVNEYAVTVKKVEQAKSKNDNNMLNIQLTTLNPATSVTGEPIPAGGVTLFHRIMISPTEKRTAEAIKRDLKRFQLACGVKSGGMHPLDQFHGKNLTVKVGFSKVTDEYPDQRNEVKGFVIP